MRHASRVASPKVSPRARSLLANSTIRIEFFVTRPTSITIPIFEKRFSESPRTQSAIRAPVNERNTATRITKGSKKLSNCAARTR